MNCCDDNGKCVCGVGTQQGVARTCDELGLCQWSVKRAGARCPGCIEGLQLTSEGIRLAPGATEGYRAPFLGTPAQRRELVRLLKFGALWVVVFGLSGYAAALIAGWLP